MQAKFYVVSSNLMPDGSCGQVILQPVFDVSIPEGERAIPYAAASGNLVLDLSAANPAPGLLSLLQTGNQIQLEISAAE